MVFEYSLAVDAGGGRRILYRPKDTDEHNSLIVTPAAFVASGSMTAEDHLKQCIAFHYEVKTSDICLEAISFANTQPGE